MIVGFAGKKRSGKSTAAQALIGADFEPMSFADPIKLLFRVVMEQLGATNEQIIWAETHKEEIIPLLGISRREFYQSLGTGWGRNRVNIDIWVRAAWHHYSMKMGDVVFDDVRFENEARMIRDAGGIIIHIYREQTVHDDHESENGIEFVDGDYSISNSAEIQHLHDTVMSIVDSALAERLAHA